MRLNADMSHERRIFTEQILSEGIELPLSKEDAHHLFKVLRLRAGALAVVVSSGQEWEAVVCSEEPPCLKILNLKEKGARSSRVCSVAVALLKGSHTDECLHNCAQLGVRNLIVWAAERSMVKIQDRGNLEKKLNRWQAILKTSAQQSGQGRVSQVHYAGDLLALFGAWSTIGAEADSYFVCSLATEATPLEQIELTTRAHLLVGPEGDFSAREEDILQKKRISKLSLGPFRLRAETAALVAVAQANAVWGTADEMP